MRTAATLLFIVSCFSFNACQKELSLDSTDTSHPPIIIPPGSVSGSMRAKIDGAQFIADKMTGITRALGRIAITGQSSDGELIVFTVIDSGVYNYTLDVNSFSNAGAYSKNNGPAYSTNGGSTSAESGGTLSITSINTGGQTMSGTFSITVFRQTDATQKIITEGVFNDISYTTTIPPASSFDTFRVKTDGVQLPVFAITGISAIGMINISGSDQAVSKTAGVSIPMDVTPGTYALAGFGSEYMGQYNLGNSYLLAESGSITIFEHNTTSKRIRASFNFTAKEFLGTKTAILSEGYFSVVYR